MVERVVTVEELAEQLLARSRERRVIVGLAGAPGSGKSTLADRLKATLDRSRPGFSAVFPMDGFHYDDAVLRELGRLPRKGAPDTFDVGGLAHTLQRLGRNDEEFVAVPVFDRAIETARAGGRLIPRSIGIIIAEGNYLLLRRPPWDRLTGLFDLTAMVRTSPETLRRRLEARWRQFALPEDEVRRKVDTNDLPNGVVVTTESVDSDVVVDGEDAAV